MSQERKQQTVDTDHIKNFLKDNPTITPAMLCSTLGLSATVISKWLKLGKAPKWTQIAIEGLVRRTRAGNTLPQLIVIECPRDKVSMVEGFLNATNTKFTKV